MMVETAGGALVLSGSAGFRRCGRVVEDDDFEASASASVLAQPRVEIGGERGGKRAPGAARPGASSHESSAPSAAAALTRAMVSACSLMLLR